MRGPTNNPPTGADMGNGPDETLGPSEGERESPDEDFWEGMLLELEDTATAQGRGGAEPVGEETIERPIAELIPPEALPPGSVWLARWMLFAGVWALGFALLSIALALMHGTRPVGWRGGLLVLNSAVVVLILRGYLVRGAPARVVCRWGLSLVGLAASAFVIQAVTLRSAVRFIYGSPLSEVLRELFVLGLLGAAGCVIFVQCLRRRGWAGKAAGLVVVAFPALVLFHRLTGEGGVSASFDLRLPIPSAIVPGLAIAALGAAAVVAVWSWMREGPAGWRRAALAALPLLVLGAGCALSGGRLLAAQGTGEGARTAWMLGALGVTAALLPVLAAAIVRTWQTEAGLGTDLASSAQFLWLLVALGAVALVAAWLPMEPEAGKLESSLVAAAILALAAGAWLGAGPGNWAARWALVPVGGTTVAILCTLGPLLDYARPAAPADGVVWSLAVAFVWSSLVVGLILATAGLALKRHRARLSEWDDTMWRDTGLLCLAGALASGLVLGTIFACGVGDAVVRADLAGVLRWLGASGHDLLIVVAGPRVASALSTVAAGAAATGLLGPSLWVGLLAVVLAVHLAAASRLRWAVYAMAALWAMPLAVGFAFACLFAVHLVLPPATEALTVPAVRYVASQCALTRLLFAGGVVLLLRVWESIGSALVLARKVPHASSEGKGVRPHERSPLQAGGHLAFLIRCGLLAGALGLVVAALWARGAAVENALTRLGLIGLGWLRAAGEIVAGVGALAAAGPLYGGAAALVLFVLLAVHVEAARGRVAVYPLVGAAWGLLLLAMDLNFVLSVAATPSPAPPGRAPALAITGALLGLLSAATAALWIRWWRLRPASAGVVEPPLDRRDRIGAAHSLGALGQALVVLGGAAVLHSALLSLPRYAEWAVRARSGAVRLLEGALLRLEGLRLELMFGRVGWTAAALGGALSVVLLAVHYGSRCRWRTVRLGVFGLWSVLTAVGAGFALHVLFTMQFGSWSGGRIALWIALVAVVLRSLVAVCNAGSWLVPAADGERRG